MIIFQMKKHLLWAALAVALVSTTALVHPAMAQDDDSGVQNPAQATGEDAMPPDEDDVPDMGQPTDSGETPDYGRLHDDMGQYQKAPAPGDDMGATPPDDPEAMHPDDGSGDGPPPAVDDQSDGSNAGAATDQQSDSTAKDAGDSAAADKGAATDDSGTKASPPADAPPPRKDGDALEPYIGPAQVKDKPGDTAPFIPAGQAKQGDVGAPPVPPPPPPPPPAKAPPIDDGSGG
jgi:hypothetical protein